MLNLVIRLVCALALLLPAALMAEGLYNQPEGTTYDPAGHRWFVSNYGDGAIIQVDSLGNQSYFSTYPSSATGMKIIGGTLYVCSPLGESAGLIGFDLTTAAVVVQLPFANQLFCNDLAPDTSGFLYVTDWQASRIYKVRLSDHTYSVFVPAISQPNGIAFDRKNNRLLVCCTAGTLATIKAVSLADSSVTNVVNLGVQDNDGLTIDGHGNFYFSAWTTSSVYQYDPSFAKRRLVATGFEGPASIFFDSLHNVMAIPCYNADRVVFLSLPDADNDGFVDVIDNCPSVANTDQADADADGIGDACDPCTDTDNDGFGDPGFPANTCTVDNCPSVSNATQADADADGIGDACDPCTDTDGDGFGNPGFTANTCTVDNCPSVSNPDQRDTNHDGVGDACCCIDVTGNINGVGIVDLTDLSALVSYLTGGGYVPPCFNEANVNGVGIIDLADLSALVNYLTGGGYALKTCP